MSNHVHGIVIIGDLEEMHWETNRRDLINQIPTKNFPMMKNAKQTLGKVIRHFKARTARLLHSEGFLDFRWQRLFYDRIIRDEDELNRIREYVIANPSQWSEDKENPTRTRPWKDWEP